MNTVISLKYFTHSLFLVLSVSQSVFGEDLKFPQRDRSTQRLVNGTITAHLTVDVSRDRKPISKYLYGVNIAN